ncbi:MAG: DUF2203 domain-containing protein [Candidatus Bipolaricaulia bacterium]
MYQHQIHFTLEGASEALPQVKAQVKRLVQLKRELDANGYDIQTRNYQAGSAPNGQGPHPPMLQELAEILNDLEVQGILVKGFDEGLIDFPHIRENGEEVYLCWKLGEKRIGYWHRIPDGFAGRRPVADL